MPVANILADVIIMIQKEVPVHLKQGGIFITSGIIDMKEQAVSQGDALPQNDAFEGEETTRQGVVGLHHSEEAVVYHFFTETEFLQSLRP